MVAKGYCFVYSEYCAVQSHQIRLLNYRDALNHCWVQLEPRSRCQKKECVVVLLSVALTRVRIVALPETVDDHRRPLNLATWRAQISSPRLLRFREIHQGILELDDGKIRGKSGKLHSWKPGFRVENPLKKKHIDQSGSPFSCSESADHKRTNKIELRTR